MRIKKRYIALSLLGILILVFFLGPKPDYPDVDPIIRPTQISLAGANAHVAQLNAAVPHLKPDNESRILWANDSTPSQTEYVVVFLHGFSASPREGLSLASDFAARYGANCYLPLITGHGIDEKTSFEDITPADMIHSCRDAIAFAKVLGKKTIVIGSSTGCTIGIYLAAKNPDAIESLFLFSPNIDLKDGTSDLLLLPWGESMAEMILGETRTIDQWIGTESEQYWTCAYSSQGLVALKYMIHETMTDDVFAAIHQPVYVSYYYQDEEHCDQVISIDEAKRFYAAISTPDNKKKIIANGPVGEHVMTCDMRTSPKVLQDILMDMAAFAEETMGMQPIPTVSMVP